MARRSAAAVATADGMAPRRATSILGALKHFATAMMILAGGLGVIWLYLSIDNFLVTDSRFFLAGPPEPGEHSESFRIEGTRNVTEEQVIHVFRQDFGRSIFLCRLRDRRLKLLGIDWVKEASVSRLWPNRLVVRIVERTPAAFVQMSAPDGAMLLWLVDGDGVLLDPQRAQSFRLPVLTGLTRRDTEASRRERMKRFLRMQSELGSYIDKVSEIDVGDLDNLKVTQQFEDRALTLMLGNQSYRERYVNFIDNHEEIRRRLPDAVTLDLRLKDRITAAASSPRLPAAKAAVEAEGKNGAKTSGAKTGGTKTAKRGAGR